MFKRISLNEESKIIQKSTPVNQSHFLYLFNVNTNQIVSLNGSYVPIQIIPMTINVIPSSNSVVTLGNTNMISPNLKDAHNSKDSSKRFFQKNPFSPEEDNLILHLVNKLGENNWPKISQSMKQMNYDRNIRQCKDRYYHYLNPKINNSEWTNDEDELLLTKVNEIGKKWKKLDIYFPGRTEVSLRNRYNLLERKKNKFEKQKEKKIDIMSSKFSFLDDYYEIKGNYSKHQETETKMSGKDCQKNNNINYDFSESIDEDLDIHLNSDDLYFN